MSNAMKPTNDSFKESFSHINLYNKYSIKVQLHHQWGTVSLNILHCYKITARCPLSIGNNQLTATQRTSDATLHFTFDFIYINQNSNTKTVLPSAMRTGPGPHTLLSNSFNKTTSKATIKNNRNFNTGKWDATTN